MIRRNVFAAVSRMPAETARHLSWRNVIAVLSSKRICARKYGHPRKTQKLIGNGALSCRYFLKLNFAQNDSLFFGSAAMDSFRRSAISGGGGFWATSARMASSAVANSTVVFDSDELIASCSCRWLCSNFDSILK